MHKTKKQEKKKKTPVANLHASITTDSQGEATPVTESRAESWDEGDDPGPSSNLTEQPLLRPWGRYPAGKAM